MNICNKVLLNHIATTICMDVVWLNTVAVGMLSLSSLFILQKNILTAFTVASASVASTAVLM